MRTKQFNDPLKGFVDAMKAKQFDDPFKGLFDAMKAMQAINVNIQEDILSRRIPATNFEEIFLEVSHRINSTKKDGSIDEALVAVANDYRQVIENSPRSVLSLEFCIMLIISLLLHIHALYTSNESEERLSEQINNSGDAITQQIYELSEKKELFENDIYYVVDRAVNLRSSPTTKKNNVITILYPNQKTRLIDQKGKWRKVEYSNNKTGDLEVGWCYKKYLKRY